MGSKKLKAIAVKGSQGIKIADEKNYLKVMKKIRDKLLKSPYSHQYPAYGTLLLPGMLNDLGRVPSYNGQKSTFEGTEKIDGKALKKERIIKSRACGGCMLRCAQVVSIDGSKSLEGETTEGVEYESVASFGSRCGNDNVKSILKANNLCNDLGLDTIGAGSVISWAMECFEKGIITEKETGGIDLSWGNAESILHLVEDIAMRRTKFGNMLAEGSQLAANALGKGHEFLLNVKGAESPNIDARAQKSMALSYAVSPRGADHLYAFPVIEYEGYQDILRERFGAENFKDVCDSLSNKAKPWVVFVCENFGTLIDSLGICKYGTMVPPILYYDDIAEALRVTCGVDLSKKDLEEAGERVVNLNRLFNIRRGFKAEDDTLPIRYLYEKAKTGIAKGHITELKPLVDEYYKIRGWNKDGTIPKEKLESLGIIGLLYSGSDNFIKKKGALI